VRARCRSTRRTLARAHGRALRVAPQRVRHVRAQPPSGEVERPGLVSQPKKGVVLRAARGVKACAHAAAAADVAPAQRVGAAQPVLREHAPVLRARPGEAQRRRRQRRAQRQRRRAKRHDTAVTVSLHAHRVRRRARQQHRGRARRRRAARRRRGAFREAHAHGVCVQRCHAAPHRVSVVVLRTRDRGSGAARDAQHEAARVHARQLRAAQRRHDGRSTRRRRREEGARGAWQLRQHSAAQQRRRIIVHGLRSAAHTHT
jgi:hypothetical protein